MIGRSSMRSSGQLRGRLLRGLMLATALTYVLVLLLAPLGGIVYYALKGGAGAIGETFNQPDVRHALYLSTIIMVVTVVVTTVFGVLVALVLARDHFFGKRVVSAVVDLPLAVSPVIVGLMAVLLFGRGGWFESFFSAQGIQIIFALPSMILVTIFISIPFVVREVVPVLEELGTEEEQAAWTLGASRLQTFFRVTLPNIRWGLLYGIALSAARSIGEVGAVLIVSGSLQGQTETATLYILRAFDQYQEQQAYIVALTLAGFSIVLLLGIETLKRRSTREAG
ncbi:MAG: sulfate/thiosulfate transport system permease protein [Gaiellales bacterium]|nr:sulfate/thiosulfate transport system permease protein [Gaiellales bacterium]MDX6550241.1 sulfate/thiosulfate transport system permease protein [Gaiellales bacterium]